MSLALFRLVKSLNKSEKGYFKRQLEKRVDAKKSMAVKIFDVLAHQNKFDNKELLKKIELKNKNHLPMYKVMLQNMIIRMLSLYHSGGTPQSKIRKLLDSIEILQRKKQYSLCRKAIIKAKQLAYKYETFSYLHEILNYELKLEAINDVAGIVIIDKLNTEQEKALTQQKNMFEYLKLNNKLYAFAKKNQVARTPEDIRAIKKITKDPLLENEGKAMSQLAKVNYFFCKGVSAFIEGDYKQSNYYVGKQLELLNNNTSLIELSPDGYVSTVSNFVATTFQIGKYVQVEERAQQATNIINTLPEKIKKHLDLPLLNIQNVLLKMYIDTGQFEKGRLVAATIEQEVSSEKRVGMSVTQTIPILFNLGYLNFALQNYKKALHYINQLLTIKEENVRTDIHLFAKLFNIIIYFEMGELEMIPYLAKSLYRQLAQKEKLYKIEHLIIRWIKLKSPQLNNADFEPIFITLKQNIEQIISDPLEAKALEYFDFLSWVESKISGKTFAEVVRAKAKTDNA